MLTTLFFYWLYAKIILRIGDYMKKIILFIVLLLIPCIVMADEEVFVETTSNKVDENFITFEKYKDGYVTAYDIYENNTFAILLKTLNFEKIYDINNDIKIDNIKLIKANKTFGILPFKKYNIKYIICWWNKYIEKLYLFNK